jgi:sugar phosphate isomerase/epimerase
MGFHSDNATIGVFTKPWKNVPLGELVARISAMGFNSIEYPVRYGFQVDPDHSTDGLKHLSKLCSEANLQILSVAADPTESIFRACFEAGIPTVRIMAPLDRRGYLVSWSEFCRDLDKWEVWSRRYGVKIGIQPHHSNLIADSFELYTLLRDRDPETVGAIWDAAHDALTGRDPEVGLDLVWDRLLMVNLKNAYYRRISGPEVEAVWERYFTTGSQGLASWARVIRYLSRRGYSGPICLTAEYTRGDDVDVLVRQDLDFVKGLIAEVDRSDQEVSV